MSIVKFITKYTTLWVILGAAVAFMIPGPFKGFGSWIPFLLGIIMLGMGLSMTPGDFKLVFSRPRDVIVGVAVVYICMPLVGLGLGTLLSLPQALTIGLILLGCSCTGTTSNVMTFLANGDKALTVTVSSLSTMVAPIVTPALLMFYVGKYMPIDAAGLFMSIIKVVIIPIVLGLVIRKVFASQMNIITTVIPIASVLSVVFIICIVVSLNVERLSSVAGPAFAACTLYTSAGMLVGYGVSRILHMNTDKRKAMTFIVGVQQTALSVTLAITYFDPMSAILPAILIVWTTVFGTLIATVWKNRTKETKKIPVDII